MASCCSSVKYVEDAGVRRKFLVIFLLSIMGLGFSMVLDSPRSIQNVLQKELKVKPSKFELHYYLLYWPNILSWVSGFIIDRFVDVRLGTVIFITASCIGNTLYAIGGVTKIYIVMLIGWLITSLGVEASFICIGCYILRWFPTKLTNTVFAISKSMSLLGTSLVIQMADGLMSHLSSPLKTKSAFSITISIEMSLIVVPLVCAVILALISKVKRNKEYATKDLQDNQVINLKKFPLSFWLLSLTVNIFLSSCYIFLRFNVLNSKYGLNEKKAEVLVNGFRIGACLMGPIVGLMSDWKGRNLSFLSLAFAGGTMSHFSFAFIITDPFYPMMLLSFSYSLVIGSYWSLLARVVSKEHANAAIAIDHSMLMLCCAIGHGVASKIFTLSSIAVELHYLVSSFIAIIGSCCLWGLDCNENVLNRPKTKREKASKQMTKGRVDTTKNIKLESSQRFKTAKRSNDELQSKNAPESTYLRLKRYEAEGNMYKHQRIKRQTNRMLDRRKSRSNEELYCLTSQV